MSKYTMTCSQDHDPVVITVEADSDDQAMEMMMAQARPHLEEVHTEMAAMSDDELKQMITGMWTKEEAQGTEEAAQ